MGLEVGIVLPHQLFKKNKLLNEVKIVYIVEEYLFFSQYRFHKTKIAFHRATMRFYNDYLISKGLKVEYIEAKNRLSDIRKLINHLNNIKVSKIHYIDPTDNWLSKRIKNESKKHNIELLEYTSNLFINSFEEIQSYFSNKKKLLQTEFYIEQRKKNNILLESNKNPTGGKWTYDNENRQKYPKDKATPKINFPNINKYHLESIEYVNKYFP
ncbi:MAG: cryptochrome/photolyase family protein, partial [Candidatus Sericytochromatia bacterium]